MAVKKKRATFVGTQAVVTQARNLIEEQTEAFLKTGGKIQEIPRGVTGQMNLIGPRTITGGTPEHANAVKRAPVFPPKP
jgi:hypothetical protein